MNFLKFFFRCVDELAETCPSKNFDRETAVKFVLTSAQNIGIGVTKTSKTRYKNEPYLPGNQTNLLRSSSCSSGSLSVAISMSDKQG